MRLLLVDDHPEFRRLMQEKLIALGFDVHQAADADSALRLLNDAVAARQPFRVATIDEQMPGVSGSKLIERIRENPAISNTLVLMLSGLERLPNDERDLLADGFITKPARDADLTHALEKLLASQRGRRRDDPDDAPAPLPGARILVAEDNLVNQHVVTAQLQLLNCKVDVVDNGQLAEEALRETRYDLVLMDCHMPVMDGFTASRRIRDHGNTDTPIIALTADVQAGVREQCADAGMNDYLPKPFKREELEAMLRKWLWREDATADAATSATPKPDAAPMAGVAPAPEVFDPAVFEELKRLSGQVGRDVHSNALRHFLDDTPRQLKAMSVALAAHDIDTLGRIAHTLKSSSRTLGAMAFPDTCARLESACRAEQTESRVASHAEEVERLVVQYEELLPHLLAARGSQAAAEANQTVTGHADDGAAALPTASEIQYASATAEAGVDPSLVAPHAGQRDTPLILIVDDDAFFLDTTSAALNAAGFDVVTADNARSALEWAGRNVPDLVLLDAVMDDLDGFTVCRQIKDLWPHDQVPIMMVTGLDDVDSVEDAFKAGAEGFISKPVNYPILVHRVRFQLRAANDKRQLRESREKLDQAQEVARLGYWRWQVASDRFEVSEHLQQLAGMPTGSASIHLRDYLELVRAEDRRKVERTIRAAAGGAPQEALDFQMASTEQEDAATLYQTVSYSEDDGGTVIGIVQDVTEQRAAEAMIRNLAYSDTLTGLRSRGYFQNYLESYIAAALRHGERFGLLYMDLDGFKDINDSMGHDIGDRLLQTIAKRLLNELRESDVAARLGGDEFCVLIDDVDSDYIAASVAERFLRCINEPVQLGDQWVNPRVSIGIAHFPHDGRTVSSLMKAADSAMYAAKHAGKHRYAFYEPDMTVNAERRLLLEQDLRQSVENGELILHFQPQIELTTRRMAGVEALVRWNHPTRGMVPPGEFIDVAERIGFIDDLGEWVMREACKQMVAWQADGHTGFRVAVNVSPSQFRKDGFIDVVAEILRSTGCAPELLELEVTESVFQEAGEASIDVFRALNEMGVKIALDDFGTGYSSLASLKHIPLDYLKIDRVFVQDVLGDTNAATLLATIVRLGHALGYEVIAEGVETLAQVQVLYGMDCNYIQGYYFSRPVEADKVPALAAADFTPEQPPAKAATR